MLEIVFQKNSTFARPLNVIRAFSYDFMSEIQAGKVVQTNTENR